MSFQFVIYYNCNKKNHIYLKCFYLNIENANQINIVITFNNNHILILTKKSQNSQQSRMSQNLN